MTDTTTASQTMDFSAEEYAGRQRRLHAEMERAGLDAVVVLNGPNQRYLSGFWWTKRLVLAPFACVFANGGNAALICEDRLVSWARERTWIEDIRTYRWETGSENARRCIDGVIDALRSFGVGEGRIGIELAGTLNTGPTVSVASIDHLREALGDATLIEAADVFHRLRVHKSPAEFDALRRAAELTEEARTATYEEMYEGMTEHELLQVVCANLYRAGSDDLAFVHVKHLDTRGISDQPYLPGETVYMDIGGVFKGYIADYQRWAALGEPSEDLRDGYRRLVELEYMLLERVKPGESIAAFTNWYFDEAIRQVFGDDAHGERWSGHGTGLQSAEWPTMTRTTEHVFEPGMAVIVEPQVHWKGTRWTTEDLVGVTETGNEMIGLLTEPELRVVELGRP